jgi:K+-sensing histidine kinase KdpD
MNKAVEQRIKSERLKTELITNVSHDIKTPLTSIINYVDLLQKPHTEAEEIQYLEVLDRQSKRLKKLTENLVEASKASTGNMAVHAEPTSVTELINQSLEEYRERLEAGKLSPVVELQEQLTVMADGKLMWRVLDNLLNNVVKYAMPGTRVYVTARRQGEQVILAVKNISAQELNVSADELLERFVRGDESRNTEGNGLGLNIARSLMEVQKGNLELYVDGDLFKVVLTLPKA